MSALVMTKQRRIRDGRSPYRRRRTLGDTKEVLQMDLQIMWIYNLLLLLPPLPPPAAADYWAGYIAVGVLPTNSPKSINILNSSMADQAKPAKRPRYAMQVRAKI